MVTHDYLDNHQMSENFIFVDLDNDEITEIQSRKMKFAEEQKK